MNVVNSEQNQLANQFSSYNWKYLKAALYSPQLELLAYSIKQIKTFLIFTQVSCLLLNIFTFFKFTYLQKLQNSQSETEISKSKQKSLRPSFVSLSGKKYCILQLARKYQSAFISEWALVSHFSETF